MTIRRGTARRLGIRRPVNTARAVAELARHVGSPLTPWQEWAVAAVFDKPSHLAGPRTVVVGIERPIRMVDPGMQALRDAALVRHEVTMRARQPMHYR